MARHPLDPLTGEEISLIFKVLSGDRRFTTGTRIHDLALREPAKKSFNAVAQLISPPREALAVLFDRISSTTSEVICTTSEILSWEAVEGQPCIVPDEFFECEQAVAKSEAFQEAMRKRGVDKWELLMIDPWSAGSYGDPHEGDRKLRLARALTFVRRFPGDNGYARPVQGLSVLVDLAKMQVLEVIDTGVVPLPPTDGNWSHAQQTALRPGPKPLVISQPDGPSFTVNGHHVEWCGWDMRIGWTAREGLILHQICIFDYEANERRSVIHRASVCDMVVPYGDPSDYNRRKNAFDLGEYGIGILANSLELGCDCLGVIRYFDAEMITPKGDVTVIKNAICMHEEDYGVQWKHTDFRTEERGVVRSRRLVISFFSTVGNYDYGFFWYFYLDGTVQLEIKLTGIVNTGALPTSGVPLKYGTEIAPRLYAPTHQHSFSVRLDMAVDGINNCVSEVDVVSEKQDPEINPFGNAFFAQETRLSTECGRLMNFEADRSWKVTNPSRLNALGKPVAYKLCPEANATIKVLPESAVLRRAGYMARHLWVTPSDPSQRYAAGEYPNQRPADELAGLPAYVQAKRSVENVPLCLWYTLTVTHVVRPEDWPVMPCHYASLRLMPAGFFRQNPTVSLPGATKVAHSQKSKL